jgi:hypothetical protein
LAARHGISVPIEQIVIFGAVARVVVDHPGCFDFAHELEGSSTLLGATVTTESWGSGS